MPSYQEVLELQEQLRDLQVPECHLIRVDSVQFINQLFLTRKFKGIQLETHHPVQFCTDGVKLSVQFVTAGSACGDWITGRGMSIPERDPTDLSLADGSLETARPFMHHRGMYMLRERRNDLLRAERDVIMVAVDPGKRKPLQVGEFPRSGSHLVPAVQNAWSSGDHSGFDAWDIDEGKYLEETGRIHNQRSEESRREHNPLYATAIEAIRTLSKRTAVLEDLDAYISVHCAHLGTLIDEKFHIWRVKRLWKASRKRQSAFARWSDQLFDQRSIHSKAKDVIENETGFNKNHFRDPELTARFRKIKADLKETRRTQPNRVVFFGDGSFSSCARGSPPIARKAFLKTAMCTGPVVWTQEYKTSKMCPCGHPSGTLKDWNLPSGLECRLRCHQTTSTDSLCPLNDPESIPASTDLRKFDRDELATWNILQCSDRALCGLQWPDHLSRN